MDTTDDVFMTKAYEWSFSNPVAVGGTVKLVALLAEQLGAADRAPWSLLTAVGLLLPTHLPCTAATAQ